METGSVSNLPAQMLFTRYLGPFPVDIWHELVEIVTNVAPVLLREQVFRLDGPSFPHREGREKSNFLGLAMISKDICGMVMRYAYQHVTVTTESQLRRLVEAPLNERVGEWFGQTVRCDVLLPFAVSAAGIRTLVSRFPNLKTLCVEHPPPLHAWDRRGPAFPTTITMLQLGTLEVDFGCHDFETLTSCFPNLQTLQVLGAKDIDFPRRRIYTTFYPMLPLVEELYLGWPGNYMPSGSQMANNILTLSDWFESGMLFPNLTHLKVEKNVSMVLQFLRTHGRNVHSMVFSSDFHEFDYPQTFERLGPTMTTIGITVDHRTLDFADLPTSVARVVIAKPLLPHWREPRAMKKDVLNVAGQIAKWLAHRNDLEVYLDGRLLEVIEIQELEEEMSAAIITLDNGGPDATEIFGAPGGI